MRRGRRDGAARSAEDPVLCARANNAKTHLDGENKIIRHRRNNIVVRRRLYPDMLGCGDTHRYRLSARDLQMKKNVRELLGEFSKSGEI